MKKIEISNEYIIKVKEFAKNMVDNDYQRKSRTGGSLVRDNYELIENICEGKYAEYSVYQYFKSLNFDIQEPNLEIMPRKKWDNGIDMKLGNYVLEIKSSKSDRARLLLITAEDLLEKEGTFYFEHSEGLPSFVISVNVNIKNGTAYLMGYIPKKYLQLAIEHKKNYWSKGEIIPGSKSKVKFDADNYVWLNFGEKMNFDEISKERIPKMFNIEGLPNFLRRA